MAWYDRLIVGIAIAIDVVGPVVLLLLLRRRTRTWPTAFACTVAIVPIAAFLLTGGLALLATYLRVAVRGDTAIPDKYGIPVSQYLRSTFALSGIYGAMFACTGFGFSLPLVGAWRLAHPASFLRAFRPRQGVARSAVEQDFDDAPAAEPPSAPSDLKKT